MPARILTLPPREEGAVAAEARTQFRPAQDSGAPDLRLSLPSQPVPQRMLPGRSSFSVRQEERRELKQLVAAV